MAPTDGLVFALQLSSVARPSVDLSVVDLDSAAMWRVALAGGATR